MHEKEKSNPSKPEINKLMLYDLNKFSNQTGIKVDIKCQGKGAHGKIYYGFKEGKIYAIKVIYIPPEENKHQKDQILALAKNEMIFTSYVRHKNCIRSFGNFEEANSRIIVLEKAVNRDLGFLCNLFYSKKLFGYLNVLNNAYINERKESKILKYEWMLYMSESFIRFFIIQIIEVLDYLMSANLVHRDLKLENTLLSLNFTVKLGDYALTQNINPYGEYKIKNVGTVSYKSPESFDNEKTIPGKQAFKIDSYALGVILHKMLFNEYVLEEENKLFENKDENEPHKYNNNSNIKGQVVFDRLKSLLTKGKSYFFEKGRPKCMTSHEVIFLMLKLLDRDVTRRADISEVKQMTWVSKNKELLRKLHELHDNDFIKFLSELQKLDFISYYNQEKNSPDLKRKEFFYYRMNKQKNFTGSMDKEEHDAHVTYKKRKAITCRSIKFV